MSRFHAAITLSAASLRPRRSPSCSINACALSTVLPGLMTTTGIPTFFTCSTTASGPRLPSVSSIVGRIEMIPSALSARW
jgi:hypothetical protein